jgi:RhtB (resistance to homoserine/threonine) family protein
VIVHLWAFIGISVIVILAPGPDTVIVTKNALLHGRRAALGSAFGVNAGLLIWTTTAALGIAAVIRESAVAFTVIKIAGAVYLAWLGLQALRAARRRTAVDGDGDDGRPRFGWAAGFRQGLLSDLGNPKIAIFFTTLLPQFVSSHHAVLFPYLLLGVVFVAITLLWLVFYAVLAVELSELLKRPSVKAALDRISGVVLIGLGVRIALERR